MCSINKINSLPKGIYTNNQSISSSSTGSRHSIHLAVDVHGVGVQSVGVGVVEGLSGCQTRGCRVTVAKIVSARAVDAVGMGLLMENGSSLVLGMASGAKSRQIGEEDGAIGDVAGRGDSIGQNIG